MAGTKTITTYDGVKYQQVTLEEIGDTGHYREINREITSVLGILDDEKLYKEAITNINDFKNKNGTFFLLSGGDYFYLFTSITIHYPKDYENLALGVIKTIEEIGYVASIEYNDKEIIFEIYPKENEDTLIKLTLEPYSSQIKVIGV